MSLQKIDHSSKKGFLQKSYEVIHKKAPHDDFVKADEIQEWLSRLV